MKKEFKAESRRLLSLMINSIYTHKEIFLRELISNASDATDKRYYNALQTSGEALNRNDLPIEIELDSENRTVKITDHGCGMTKEDLETNLGTIAHSGSLDFKESLSEKSDDVDIIGQFGVGFYSAFMVSDKVEVRTKNEGSSESYLWTSDGEDGYTIESSDKQDIGTEITLYVKENSDDENYDEFLQEWQVRSLIKKHSDYIRYPINMEVEKSKPKEGEDNEYETYNEIETLNSMTPIWKKNKSDVSDEEYNTFYRDKFFDFQPPSRIMHSSGEGAATYQSLMFIPSHSPLNYYSKEYEKGLQLYASGVLIMDKCDALLPNYFGFVKGLVDSQDLTLNISRETLQHDRQLSVIAKRLEKKIKSELLSVQNNREEYEVFFKNFGLSIKYGVYEGYGANKEMLQDLLVYYTSKQEDKMSTLEEYVSRMPEDQKYIYYATGDSIDQLKKLPAAERIQDRGYEIIYMTDDVDEFCVKMLASFKEKEFRSIAESDLGLESTEEKEEMEKQSEENKDLFSFMKDTLGDDVAEVKLSTRLKSHPVCLSSKGEVSLEMEKVLGTMPGGQEVKAQRVLEINASHPIFGKLADLLKNDKDKLTKYTGLLYDQALLMEGMDIEDPIEFSRSICELMI